MFSVLQVNRLNNRVNNRIASIPIWWNDSSGTYEFDQNHKYFRFCAGIKFSALIVVVGFALSVDSVSENFVVLALLATSLFIGTVDDILLFREGSSLALAGNCVLQAYNSKAFVFSLGIIALINYLAGKIVSPVCSINFVFSTLHSSKEANSKCVHHHVLRCDRSGAHWSVYGRRSHVGGP